MGKPQNITTKEKWDQSDEFSKNSWEWLSISSETLVEKEKNSSVFSAANFSIPRLVWPASDQCQWPLLVRSQCQMLTRCEMHWNVTICTQTHADWLPGSVEKGGEVSKLWWAKLTDAAPHAPRWLDSLHNRILFCPQLSTASLLARPWPLPLADTFSFLEFLGPPSWRGAAVAPYISPSII